MNTTTAPSVSQKWLIGILTSIIFAGGAGWMTYVQGQLRDAAAAQQEQRKDNAVTQRDTAVIKEKVERLERDVKEIKEDQKEQGRKLDELLRRVR